MERPYFLLDFQRLKSLESIDWTDPSDLSETAHNVKNVLITENFLSFDIETIRKGGFSTVGEVFLSSGGG